MAFAAEQAPRGENTPEQPMTALDALAGMASAVEKRRDYNIGRQQEMVDYRDKLVQEGGNSEELRIIDEALNRVQHEILQSTPEAIAEQDRIEQSNIEYRAQQREDARKRSQGLTGKQQIDIYNQRREESGAAFKEGQEQQRREQFEAEEPAMREAGEGSREQALADAGFTQERFDALLEVLPSEAQGEYGDTREKLQGLFQNVADTGRDMARFGEVGDYQDYFEDAVGNLMAFMSNMELRHKSDVRETRVEAGEASSEDQFQSAHAEWARKKGIYESEVRILGFSDEDPPGPEPTREDYIIQEAAPSSAKEQLVALQAKMEALQKEIADRG